MEALGRTLDLACGIAPMDLRNATTSGNRVHLKNYGHVTIVLFKDAGAANDDPTIDIQQHTAASGGTTADLDAIDHYYLKRETTLDGDETWEKETQTAASEVADPGGDTTSAEQEQIVVIEVDASELSDGYEWISADVTVGNTGAQLGCVLYILGDLQVQRTPVNLANPQA